MRNEEHPKGWWKPWSIPRGAGARWEIGPLTLDAFHLPGEWLLAHRNSGAVSSSAPWTMTELDSRPEIDEVERFVAGKDDAELVLQPRLADRSVVARPRTPFHVLPGEETRIYVASPIWVEVTTGGGRTLLEAPAVRMSDTWFGSSTREGDITYSLPTYARSDLSLVPRRTYRAITPVTLRNESHEMLALDRMNLPIPYLSVFGTPTSELWTERITLVRGEHSEFAALEADTGPPREAVHAERLTPPRRERSPKLLVRAFASLMKPFQVED